MPFFATALLAPVFLAAAPASSGTTKVAVIELGSLGLQGRDNELPRALESYLRNSIATIQGMQLIPALDVQMALQDPRLGLSDCAGGPKCALRLGQAVGADRVVFGTISAAGQAYSLNARAIDVASGKEVARHTATISGSRDALIPEVRLTAFKLLAPDKIRGSLLVDIDVSDVVVEIDGQRVGVTPLAEPVANLAPGPHVVVLRRAGYSEFQQEFSIKPFETLKLKLQLEAEPSGAASR